MALEPTSNTPRALEDLSEQSLVEAAKSSKDAFAVLYRAYLPTVYGYLVRRTGNREVAEDLTAATFEKALTALDDYEWRGVPFGAWLIRIASRKLTDHYRMETRRATDPVDPADACEAKLIFGERDVDAGDLATLIGDAEQVDLIIAALDDLSPRYRDAIVLRFLSELTSEEAAEALGCTRPTFAVLLHRSVKSLRKAVERRGYLA